MLLVDLFESYVFCWSLSRMCIRMHGSENVESRSFHCHYTWDTSTLCVHYGWHLSSLSYTYKWGSQCFVVNIVWVPTYLRTSHPGLTHKASTLRTTLI